MRALAMLASVSKERRASTSVEMRPGTIFSTSRPMLTASLSPASMICCALSWLWDLAQLMASSISAAYSGISDAFNTREGLVVASMGW
ncbi:hypothetical protein D3C84_907120 [compost metagenome]